MKLDLSKVRKELDEFEVTLWTPHFIVMKAVSGEEVTLRRDGRMIVRNSDTEANAEAAAVRVLSLISQL